MKQSKIIAQYEAILKAVTAHHPLILVLEDLHWADPASLGLLFRLGQQLAHHRLFILASYRSEQMYLSRDDQENALEKMLHELQRQQGDITIDLETVRMTEGRVLVDGLLDTEPNQLKESFRQALYHHTGGHPLFVVELLEDLKGTAALVRNREGDWIIGDKLDWRNLPAKVEGAIAGRIAHLSAEQRWLLTIASVSGERFLAEVVAHVGGSSNREVVQALSQELQVQHRLVEAERVERLGEQRLTRYRFRHNLIQAYLYEQLDEVQRTYLHEDVARALELIYDEDVGQMALPLVRHYQAAGVTQKAIDYLILAGQQARRLAANDEAIEHFTQADHLLATLPDNTTTQQQTFVVQFNLGQALTDSKGDGSEEAGMALMRALELGRQLGESHQLARVLFALTDRALSRVEMNSAQAYGEECLRLAEENQDPELQMEAHRILQLVTYLWQQYAASAAHAEQVSTFYHTHRPTLTDEEASDLGFTTGMQALLCYRWAIRIKPYARQRKPWLCYSAITIRSA